MRYLIVAMGGALILSAVFFLRSRTAADSSDTPAPIARSKTIFLGPRKPLAAISTKKRTAQTSQGCSEVLASLEEMDFSREEELSAQDLRNLPLNDCTNKKYRTRINALKSDCRYDDDVSVCVTNAVLLRSLLRTEGVLEAEDREGLADLVLREFAVKDPDFKQLIHHTEKLMELAPEPAIQKLWAMAKVIDKLQSGGSPQELSEEIRSRLDPSVLESEDALVLDLALKTGMQPEVLEKTISEMLSEQRSARMLEYLGWSQWRQDKREEALASLAQAMALAPEDDWLREQYQRLTATSIPEDGYQARFSLGINLQDLFQ